MESTSDPSPYSAYDSHGTSCAGEIGMARDNSYCGVGVAYDCRLGGEKNYTIARVKYQQEMLANGFTEAPLHLVTLLLVLKVFE